MYVCMYVCMYVHICVWAVKNAHTTCHMCTTCMTPSTSRVIHIYVHIHVSICW